MIQVIEVRVRVDLVRSQLLGSRNLLAEIFSLVQLEASLVVSGEEGDGLVTGAWMSDAGSIHAEYECRVIHLGHQIPRFRTPRVDDRVLVDQALCANSMRDHV